MMLDSMWGNLFNQFCVHCTLYSNHHEKNFASWYQQVLLELKDCLLFKFMGELSGPQDLTAHF